MDGKGVKEMLFGDFGIVSFEYDAEKKQAVRLYIWDICGVKLNAPYWLKREQVIGLVEDGFLVVPLKGERKGVALRQWLHVVLVNGVRFLRLDRKLIAEDWIADWDEMKVTVSSSEKEEAMNVLEI